MNNEVTLAGAFLAGLVSFLSPCVLPLVPGYISMLSGVGMEQLRQGQVPRSGLFSSAVAFVTGFSVVFISFGAAASAVGAFLNAHRHTLTPLAVGNIFLHELIHRANEGNGAVRIHSPNRAAQRVDHTGRILRGSRDQVVCSRTIHLIYRYVDCRLHVQQESSLPDIFHHPHDSSPRFLRSCELQPFSDGIDAGPVTFREELVDDDDRLAGLDVPILQEAA